MKKKTDIIIPVYRPGRSFEKLLAALGRQTVKPDRIIVVNTEKKLWDEGELDKSPFVSGNISGIRTEVFHVKKEEFDHGGTRAWAADMSDADYLMFMTQDAVPADSHLVEALVNSLESDERIGAAYARQLPLPDCRFLEKYARSFNYGEESRVRSAEDIPVLGVKAFFCSDVCAMYRRSAYDAVGGFVRKTIFNEDMICAGTMIRSGYKIAYAAEAKVFHSHNYSGIQQFHRNFDLGVSQAEHPEVFAGIRSESEGIRLVKSSAGYLIREKKPWLIPQLIWQSGCKYLGYRAGKHYRKLPHRIVLRCTSQPGYWKRE